MNEWMNERKKEIEDFSEKKEQGSFKIIGNIFSWKKERKKEIEDFSEKKEGTKKSNNMNINTKKEREKACTY